MIDQLKPGARFDLHLHTTRSDGAFELEDLLERCVAGQLDAVAVTDHDLVGDLDTELRLIDGKELVLIAGAEVTGQHDGHEFHLLVYFPGSVPQGFRDFCVSQSAGRAERYEGAVANLGMPLPLPDAAARRGERAITRFHLAQALVEAGHADHIGDAFCRYLRAEHGLVPRLELTFIDAIRIARGFGGITSWAHPPVEHFKRYIDTFAAAGLQGVEALRPGLDRTARRTYKKACKRHGLFVTGGSDFHGWARPQDLGLHSVRKHELKGFLEALHAA